VNRNTPNSTPALAAASNEVAFKYQQLGRDIELLRDFLVARDERAGIDLRIAACQLACAELTMRLSKLQIDALRERRLP